MMSPFSSHALFAGLLDGSMAHVLALSECGTLPGEEKRCLLSALLELHDAEVQFSGGSIERSLDAFLAERTGDKSAWLYVDRTHLEALAIAFQLSVRDRILDLARRHLALADVMITVAERNRDVPISERPLVGTTQATTLGYTLLTFVYPVFRDLERLQHCYRAFNSSPAGMGDRPESASPLNRDRLRTLLGFDEIRAQCRDGLWQADSPIELMAAIVALMVNLNRLADDLRKWHPHSSSMGADVSWIRGRTAELLTKVPALAALGKEASNDADGGVFAATEFATAFDSALRAIEIFHGRIAQADMNRDATPLESHSAPERILEMVAECRARMVRENLWVTTATLRLERSRGDLLDQARAEASK